jgi:hypothetical protein
VRAANVLHDPVDARGVVLEERHEQVLLLIEVDVEGALGDPCLLADVVDREGLEAPPRGTAPRCIDELLTTFVTDGRSQARHRIASWTVEAGDQATCKPTGQFLILASEQGSAAPIALGGGTIVATSTELEGAARSLSDGLTDTDEAVGELLRLTEGRRVSLVRARQHLSDLRATEPEDRVNERAEALIEKALQRGSWSE